MSAHSHYDMDSHRFQYPPYHQPSSTSELKQPYSGDDYDDFAFPVDKQAQTFNVDPQAMHSNQHRRNPSRPLDNQPYSLKHATESSVDQSQHNMYPPLVPQKELNEADAKPFWRRLLPDSMACRLFMLTVLIETTIDLIIEGELLIRVHHETEDNAGHQRMSAYLSIFVFAHIFQFIMAVDAVYNRNTLQFVFLIGFNALFLLYAIVQIKEVQEALVNVSSTSGGVTSIPINVLTTIIPVVISVAEIAFIGLVWKIYHEFGWKVYKFLGADRRIKKMYANYQIYECLIKFDVFFWAGFSIQFIWLVLQTTDWEYYVTCAALPLSLVLLVEGHLAAKHENKLMMITFMSGCVGAMIYFVYKLVKVLVLRGTDEFHFIWKTLTVFSVIAIILLFATFVFSIMLLRNFGRGLKASLNKTKTKTGHSRDPSRPLASTNPNRMSID
jgi:hypothetical protein